MQLERSAKAVAGERLVDLIALCIAAPQREAGLGQLFASAAAVEKALRDRAEAPGTLSKDGRPVVVVIAHR